MTRAFGDFNAESLGVNTIPDIREYDIQDKKPKIIVLATNGIWQFLSNEKVKNILLPYYEEGNISGGIEKLVNIAVKMWETKNQDYTPTKRIINHIAHLIKEENRHMFARAPEITINPVGDDEKNKERCKALENWIRRVLEDSGWQAMLPKAGRDACIGKRVTLKLTGGPNQPIRVGFRPALESFSDSDPEDSTRIDRIVFLYSTTPGVVETRMS